jgi:probable F420-dependent oxidoreductase
MKIGLCSANGGVCTEPGVLGRVAEHAEAAGLESLWVSEHLVVPDPRTAPSHMDPDAPILDPIVALAVAAARTTTLRLGTGVIVLPLRNPLIVAKEIATLDVLSDGRVLVGVGVGYVDAEFRALGVPFHDRGERTDEYLEVMRAIWTQEHPSFHGRLFDFDGVQAYPRPLQRPHPPVVVGGWSEPALRRAASTGSGWYGWGLDHDETASTIARLRAALGRAERDPALGELEITITPKGPVDLPAARRYAELGVDRLNLPVHGRGEADLLRFVEDLGTNLVGRV